MTRPSKPLLFVAALLIPGFGALIPASGNAADFNDELTAAAQEVTKGVLLFDEAETPRARADALRAAIDAIGIVSTFAGQSIASEAAVGELKNLALQGLTPDVLRLGLVDALLPAFSKDGTLQQDLEIKKIVGELSDPAYRSAGWAAIARAHRKRGEAEEAERLAERAVEEARSIEREATRNGALRAAVLSAAAADSVPPVVARASDLMTTASARAALYQEIARLQFDTAGKDRPSDSDLAGKSGSAFQKGDLPATLRAAQAMDRDAAERDAQIESVLAAALSSDNEALALEAAKSLNGNAKQDRALRRIVDGYIQAGFPLRGVETARLMLRGKARADAQIAAADGLRTSGHRQAALDVLRGIDLSGGEREDVGARIVDRLAALGAFDEATRIARAITRSEERSTAFSRLSKRLSDAGRLEEAKALLKEAERADDRSFALAGLSRGLAEAGRIEEARALAETIAGADDRDRAWEGVVSALAHVGRLDDAKADLTRIAGPRARARALVDLSKSGEGTKQDTASAALDTALDALGTAQADDERADIAVRWAERGALARADAVLAGMEAETARRSAEAAVALAAANGGALDEATRRLATIEDPSAKAEVAGAIALARQAAGGSLKALVAELRPLPYAARVKALRAAAAREAAGLDRNGWIAPTNALTEPAFDRAGATPANFTIGGQSVSAPALSPAEPADVAIPDFARVTAAALRENMPAPAGGTASLAVLGFSPFSQEAFKLTSKGREAIYEVQRAQNLTWPRYIAIEKGTMSLDQVRRQLPEAAELGMLATSGSVMTVRVPIVVLPGATLVLSGQEFSQYHLSATTGAFLAVAGRMFVQDTSIVGYDEALDHPAEATDATKADFRPFITAWGGSDLQIAGSHIGMLGYDAGKAYGLTQSTGAAVQNLYRFSPSSPKGVIADNSFENLRYGYYSYEVDGVAVVGNEYRNNVVYGIDPHDRSLRLLIALNTAYGTHKKHGIIVSREVNDSFIVANVSVDNHGSGIMLDRMSLRNTVYANTSVDNGGDGLSFYESGCNLAVANRLTGNRRAGVKVRNSSQVAIFHNTIADNQASGTDVYASDLRNSPEGLLRNFVLDPFEPVASTILGSNRFSGNGLGINSSGATHITLEGNRFTDQRNQVFSGELRPLSSFLLQIGQRSSVSVNNVCGRPPPADACHAHGETASAVPAASPPAFQACSAQDTVSHVHTIVTEESDG